MVGPQWLNGDDALELGEMLSFAVRWLDSDADLTASFAVFVGHPAYDLAALRADMARFAVFLGADDVAMVCRAER